MTSDYDKMLDALPEEVRWIMRQIGYQPCVQSLRLAMLQRGYRWTGSAWAKGASDGRNTSDGV